MKNSLGLLAVVKSEDGTVYASCRDFNALCEVDLKNGKVKYVKSFEGEVLFGKRLHVTSLCVKEHIYFIPESAEKLAIYNIKNNQFMMVEIKEVNQGDVPNYKKKNKFDSGIVYGKYIYLLPCTYPAVIRYDTESGRMDYYDDWLNGTPYTFRRENCIIDNKVYMTSASSNAILEFDLELNKGKIHQLENNSGCWGICNHEDDIWMSSSQTGAIIKWNPKTGVQENYEQYPELFDGKDAFFTKIYLKDNTVNVIPAKSNMPVYIDLNSTSKIIQEKKLEILNDNDYVGYIFDVGQWICLKITKQENEKYIMLNLQTEEYYDICFQFENREEYLSYISNNIKDYKSIIRETEIFALKDFIGAI